MASKNIIVLGSQGMLGQMVKKIFMTKGYNVITIDERISENNYKPYMSRINNYDDSIIVNCIGKIRQKSSDINSLLFSNAIIPLSLANALKPTHIVIHPSTDCVFDGNTKSPYNSFDVHTATDIYGWSKSLGESAMLARSNSIIIRVSIIGPDKNSSKGLLSWFLSQPNGSVVNGYTNHYWNGITTLEWCEQLALIIQDDNLLSNILKKKLIQLGTEEIYSKYDMLKMFSETFNKDITIKPVKSNYINRSLKSEMVSLSLEYQLSSLLNSSDNTLSNSLSAS